MVNDMDENVIKSEIEQAIAQVDASLTIDEFSCIYDKEKRNLKVIFTAKNSEGDTVEVTNRWG